jgi:hypothetical protein
MLSLTLHPWMLFVVFFVGLIVVVETGIRFRLASPDSSDEERHSLIRSAREGLTVLLSFLLGFALPMTLPHYELRRDLMIEEANAIRTVDQRAQMLPEPFRGRMIELLRDYVEARVEFGNASNDEAVEASSARAKSLQSEMWQDEVAFVQQTPNFGITPIVATSLGNLADLNEQRLAAYERRIPGTIWLVLTLISVLACLVVGYSMRRRLMLAMVVLPLTVAIVLSLVSELDNPRMGFIRVEQDSMLRLQAALKAEVVANQTTPAPKP